MDDGNKLVIIYASQTGSAVEVAERLERDSLRRNFHEVKVYPMDEYPRENLDEERTVIFVVSTTGDGDPPDMMRGFWRFLMRKNLPPNVLSDLRFTVFGLGDSSYRHYNIMARKLYARLLRLGAKPLCDLGLGDDQSPNGLEGDFDAWCANHLWNGLFKIHPLPPGFVVDDSPRLKPAKVKIEWVDTQLAGNGNIPHVPPLGRYHDEIIVGRIVENTRITARDWEQDVRHVDIELPQQIDYKAGDIAVIQPKNVGIDIDAFARRFDVDPRRRLRIRDKTSGRVLVGPCTVRELLTSYLDILGVPKRSTFEALYFSTENAEVKEKLLELFTSEGNDLFHSYCKKERKTFVEIFQDFPDCKPDFQFVVDMIPRLKPREFSISSSALAHGRNHIHLTVALVRYQTPWKREKVGVCSSWIETLQPGDPVPLWIKQGTLRVPSDNGATPAILIGPGTGVAPMRSIIYDEQKTNRELHLYFGCRHADKDCYYQSEWEDLLKRGGLNSLRIAFSRDTPGRKVYVQKLLKQDSKIVYDILINRNGCCFISGSAKNMPNQVREALVEAIQTHGNVDLSAAEQVVKQLEHQGRLKLETWS